MTQPPDAPVRVLHFADVHIGMENFGKLDSESGVSQRVRDFLARFDEMVAYARSHEADLVVFSGDAFKTSTPSPTYQREFAHRIMDLAAFAPVILLIGNHDIQPNISKASSIEIYDTLAVPNVIVADDYDVFDVNTRRGRVVIGTAPYPIRSLLMQDESLRGLSIREVDEKLEGILTTLLKDLAERADKLAGVDVPRLLMAHFTVSGAVLGSERSVMLGRDVQVPLSLLADDRWDYVALGHIHKHQNLTHDRLGAPPVVYSGSIERIDFGEEADDKGFCWLELARHDTAWRFVPLSARPMVTLDADCTRDPHPTETLLKLIRTRDVRDAIVRVRVTLTTETEALLKDERVREALRQAGAYHIASIKRDVHRPERTRLGISPEGLSQIQLLEKYLQSRESLSPERRARLMELAKGILDGEA
mgnify:CR=1 FL=1